MKDNLPYFSHDNNARNHPKMKALIAEYGYEGYGRFWALNERIAESPGAFINISRKVNKLDLAKELGLDGDSLDKFLKFLSDPEIDLINIEENRITTDRLTECFNVVNSERERARENKEKSKSAKVTAESAKVTAESDTDEMILNEMKINEIKQNDDDTENQQPAAIFLTVQQIARSQGFYLSKKQANNFHCLDPTWFCGEYNYLVFAAERIKSDSVYSEKSHSEQERLFASGWKYEGWIAEYPIWLDDKLKTAKNRVLKQLIDTPPKICPGCSADTKGLNICPSCGGCIEFNEKIKEWVFTKAEEIPSFSESLKIINRNSEPDF